jgi:hypothetical protein
MIKKAFFISAIAIAAVGGFVYGMQTSSAACPLEGTADCPKVNCPLKGTPLCPFDTEAVAACCMKAQ